MFKKINFCLDSGEIFLTGNKYEKTCPSTQTSYDNPFRSGSRWQKSKTSLSPSLTNTLKKNTSACKMTYTEHLLNTGSRT